MGLSVFPVASSGSSSPLLRGTYNTTTNGIDTGQSTGFIAYASVLGGGGGGASGAGQSGLTGGGGGGGGNKSFGVTAFNSGTISVTVGAAGNGGYQGGYGGIVSGNA